MSLQVPINQSFQPNSITNAYMSIQNSCGVRTYTEDELLFGNLSKPKTNTAANAGGTYQASNTIDQQLSSLLSLYRTPVNYNDAQKSYGSSAADTVANLYREILKREPDPEGLENWVNHLNNGMDISTMRQHFYNSDEFKTRFPGQAPSVQTPIQNSYQTPYQPQYRNSYQAPTYDVPFVKYPNPSGVNYQIPGLPASERSNTNGINYNFPDYSNRIYDNPSGVRYQLPGLYQQYDGKPIDASLGSSGVWYQVPENI